MILVMGVDVVISVVEFLLVNIVWFNVLVSVIKSGAVVSSCFAVVSSDGNSASKVIAVIRGASIFESLVFIWGSWLLLLAFFSAQEIIILLIVYNIYIYIYNIYIYIYIYIYITQ